VIVAQLGARRHYAIPRILHDDGRLHRFVTDLSSAQGWPASIGRRLPSWFGGRSLQRFLGRSAAGVPPELIRSFPTFGLMRALRARFDKTPTAIRARHLRDNQAFARRVAAAGFAGADAVYGFNGACLEYLQAARDGGLATILEQTSSPVEFEERMLAGERDRFQGWEAAGVPESVWRPMAERERAEWALADLVLAGSNHVREAMGQFGFVGRCCVVPYGIDPAAYPHRLRRAPHRPLRVLFVGNVRLLKGVGHLMEAARAIGPDRARFRAVGSINLTPLGRAALAEHVELLGPVPRSQVRSQYEWADLMVFPTLSEGSANVCYESLASGLPVLTTSNAGSVVRDGLDGMLMPAQDHAAIVAALNHVIDEPSLLEHWSAGAIQRAAEFTWPAYARRLLAAIDTLGPST
jgi:glycosyltransferase involved in cell wall biosynthesis